MIRQAALACLSALALLAAAGPARAMPSNYPKLDNRQVNVPTIETGTLNDGPDQKIVIENKFVRLVIEPERGGDISSFYDKISQIEYTKRAGAGNDFGGLFRNYAPNTPAKNDWEYAHFEIKEVQRSPEEVSVHLAAKGVSGAYAGVTLNKTFALRAEGSKVRVDMKVENSMASAQPLLFTLHVHNTVGIVDTKGYYFWPVEQGVAFQDAPGGNQEFIRNPTRGWLGYVNANGDGLAMMMEYRLVQYFYYWNSQPQVPQGTLEWRYNELSIPAGSEIHTTAWLFPFRGIKRPNGVASDGVGQIDCSGATTLGKAGTIKATLWSPADLEQHPRTLVLKVRKFPNGPWSIIKSQDVHFDAEKPMEFDADYTPTENGTHEVLLLIQKNGREMGRIEAPLVVGQVDEPYKLAALEQRYSPLETPSQTMDFNFSSLKVVTPHVAWAKPYAGGNAGFMFLADGFHQREAVELAERFDLSPCSSFLTPDLGPALHVLGDYNTGVTQNDLLVQMQKLYSEKNEVGTLLLSGPVWKWFTPWMRSETILRVQNGMGLVWIDPQATTPDIEAILPVVPAAAGARRVPAQWQRSDDHFIPRGLPLDAQPPTGVAPLTLAPDSTAVAYADPLSKGDPIPLVAVRQVGKGRVVVLNYDSDAGPDAGHRITPVADPPEYDIQEYQLGLVARSLFWAANKTSPASIESIDIPADASANSSLTVHLQADQPVKATLQVTFRDRFYRIIDQRDVAAPLDQGKSTVAVGVDPSDLLNGINFIDLILTVDGKALDWHTRTLRVNGPAVLASLKTDQPVYEVGKPVKLSVQVKGGGADMRVRFRLTDTDGRIVFDSSANPADGQASVTAAIARPSTLRLIASADLMTNKGRVLDTQRCNVDYRFIPPTDDLMVTYAWPEVSEGGMAPYLVRPMYEALTGIGQTGWHLRAGHVRPDEIDAIRSLDLPIEMSNGDVSLGRQPFSGEPLAAWLQTRDKKDLIRNPSLGDPAVLDAFQKQIASYATKPGFRFGAYDMAMGNENTFSQTGFDLSFAPADLKGLRAWLRDTYGTLDALNKEWETAFTSWDQVVPLTRNELAGRKSWAPWLDHRLYGDKAFADAFRACKDALAAAAPGARASASGTADTESLTGYDWWLLRNSFGALSPYPGEQNIQQRSFMPDVPQTCWLGYGQTSLPDLRRSAWQALFRGSTRGFSVYDGRNNVNPDLTIPQPGAALGQVFAEMNHGAARALFLTRPRLDPVVYHYSPRSLWTEIPLADQEQAQRSTAGMSAIMDAAGVQYGYVAYEQLEQGLPDKSDWKVMFLRHSTALSDKEAAAMRGFVERGGVLVADLLPGALTEHGRLRDGGALDDIFGVQQAGTLVHGDGLVAADGKADGIDIPKLSCDIGVAAPLKLTSGVALGSWQIGDQTGPAVVVHRFGKGCAVYLATDMLGAYLSAQPARATQRGQLTTEPLEALVNSILARAGVQPAVSVTDPEGKPFAAGVYRFAARNLNMIGLIDQSGQKAPSNIDIHLNAPACVFDVLAGKVIADHPVDHFQVAFAPQDAGLYALLDYAPTRIDLKLPDHAAPGQPVTLDIALDCGSAAAVADHVFRLDVVRPDGTSLRPLTGNFTSDHGKLKLACDLALNEPAGAYKVTVREVFTGLTASGQFTLP